MAEGEIAVCMGRRGCSECLSLPETGKMLTSPEVTGTYVRSWQRRFVPKHYRRRCRQGLGKHPLFQKLITGSAAVGPEAVGGPFVHAQVFCGVDSMTTDRSQGSQEASGW
jgi:hypothetical protein